MSRSRNSSKGPLALLRRWWRKRRSRRDSLGRSPNFWSLRFSRSWHHFARAFHWRRKSPRAPKVVSTNRKSQRTTFARWAKRSRLAAQSILRLQKPIPVAGSINRKLQWQHFLNPIHWIVWPLGFCISYFTSRPFLSLGPALFAIAVVISLSILTIQQRYQGGNSTRSQNYQRMLIEQIQAKDYRRALICCKTLIDLAPNDLRYQFEKAKIEKELGHNDLARDLMLRLATQRQYGTAALWIVDEKLNLEKIPEWSKEDHELFRAMMGIAVNHSGGTALDASKLKLASYLTALNANADALKYLIDIAPQNPQFALPACELAFKINDQVTLQNLIPIAKRFYDQQLQTNPSDVKLRLQLGRVLILDQDIDSAIQLVEDGYRLTQAAELQDALAEAFILKGDQIARGKQTPDAIMQRMQLVYRAAELASNNPLVVEAVVDLLIQYRDNQNQEAETLREAALQGLSPEAIHFVRGTIALMDQKIDEAKSHLELAAKSGVQLPGLLNNLAVALASDEKGDLNQALTLINTSLEQMEHPYFYETRGQILFKLERFQDCIIDLEKGLRAPELAPAIYRSLIVAHSKLGNTNLQKEYEERLAAIEAQKKLEAEKQLESAAIDKPAGAAPAPK